MPDDPTPAPAADGGATPPSTPPQPQPGPPTPEPSSDEPLGDGGLKALQAERTARAAAEAKAKELQAQLDEAAAAQMTDQERAVDEARKEGEATATTKVQAKLFAAEAKVAASGKLQDPTLLGDPDVALKLLGFKEMPVDAAGDIDSEAISKAIDKLIQDKPYLAVTNGAKPSPGSADGGARGGDPAPARPGSLGQAVARAMTPD